MTISCLTVTQLDRLHLLRRCLRSFSRQTVDPRLRELVLVHHDGSEATAVIRSLLVELKIEGSIVEVPRAPLGTLRNLSIEHAAGEFLCQWDDDDVYHPDRLLFQSGPFVDNACIATALQAQLVWFCDEGDVYVRKGGKEGIHGTVMFRRDTGLQYNAILSRGEDSDFMNQLLAQRLSSVHRVDDHPELYVRTYHGRNTWDLEHHYRQVRRAMSLEWLRANEAKIRDWLKILEISDVRVRDGDGIAFTT